ncbi:ABC transporter ATP-binding protein [Vannielia litorea]|uniref:ABC-2 type transport system ATP-binding protein n=1 Tax=Vannielia litorea TaxID=1217970 RepID=A0A1N6H119_9RHOB|nr:ABC transporter ATP-binding protein [Vannielia litorea]SIO13392.1 ABC-2 type transport system ATP-binding protein [Vannielia litorea]
MAPIISIKGLQKTYDSGHTALHGLDLDIEEGEILALLGPNGAGKTTTISAVCGLIRPTGGTVTVGGHNIATDYRAARAMIGLVPQEISIEPFERVMNTVRFSRGLFGKRKDDAYLEKVLRSLSLWDKKDSRNNELSGGMKRRVLIAKALSHEPRVLFLDEPTAGVDVNLRKDMWQLVRELRADGVTIILTTHYIEEAEEMADRIGVIDKGRLLLVEEKDKLMKSLGRKELVLELAKAPDAIPASLAGYELELEGNRLTYTFDTTAESTGVTRLMADLAAAGLKFTDLSTRQSSLEDVFLSLVDEGQQKEVAQ